MATVKLVLHKSWKRKDDTYPLVFQILHNKRKKIIYTGYRLQETDFNKEKQQVSPLGGSGLSASKAKTINRALVRRHKALLEKIATLETAEIPYTVNQIEEKQPIGCSLFLIPYLDDQIVQMKRCNREGTAEAYRSTRNSLTRFLQNRAIRISEITSKFVRSYENYLVGCELSPNTISYYIRNLKTIYNRAIQETAQDAAPFPFKTVRTAPCKTPKRAINRNELICIANLELHKSHQNLTRDVFLFSFYCRGMSFVDVAFLRKSDIVGGTIVYSRRKSKQPLRIAIIPPLQRLIDKYQAHPVYVLPLLDSTSPRSPYEQYRSALRRINDNLKLIGEQIDLPIPLTTYVARHTWATEARNFGAPIGVISEGLGHASEQNTRIYLKALDSRLIDKKNEEISNFSLKSPLF